MADLAYIHNLSELATWTSGGSHAKPRFSWVFSDGDGGAQSAFQVRVYADNAGAAGTLLYTSGKTAGADSSWDSSTAGVLNTQYWWSVELWDDMDESSGESSKTSFKMLWGQAIYEYNVGASASWQFSSASVPSGTQKALLFRTATAANGVGASSWVTTIGDLTPADYLNVMVRLATTVSTTQPALTDMLFTYTGSASTPDHWTTSGGTWSLDTSSYRYGSRSFKCVVTDNSDVPEIYPYRFVAGDDIVVQPNTDYMISVFVRTDPNNAFGVSSSVRLRLYAGGSNTDVLATGAAGQSYGDGATSDSSSSAEGWQRLVLRYRTVDGETLVRPKVQYVNGGAGAGDVFWVDCMKIEPGTVASTWAPGWISEAVAIDSYGVQIDGSGGATFRLRHTNGTDEVDLDEIVTVVSGGGGGGLTNLEGGDPSSTYGGTTAVDGGAP